jgi:hypothetical protein
MRTLLAGYSSPEAKNYEEVCERQKRLAGAMQPIYVG